MTRTYKFREFVIGRVSIRKFSIQRFGVSVRLKPTGWVQLDMYPLRWRVSHYTIYRMIKVWRLGPLCLSMLRKPKGGWPDEQA